IMKNTVSYDSKELERICGEVIIVARIAGDFIQQESKKFTLDNIEHKSAKELVSYVDKEAEKLIVKKLKIILPEAGFITEEGTEGENSKSLTWIIDPLDGTTNFLHKLPTYSVCIALMLDGNLLVGVVNDPNLGECFYAWKGGGAYCNNKKIKVSEISTLENSLIAIGFPYSLLDRTEQYFQIFSHLIGKTHGVRRLGSAAIDLCYVACGRFEAYFEYNLHIWDIAAGILIVQEAGGKICDYKGGNNYLYGAELLATGRIEASMLKVIQEYWK
ncbi:MAG TPA: inositol monophosphatase family protein, partial [Cytophagaceae bacterium]|nr:inositol monophosphatase family protein [Cytophagaceae bacterium]